jgi:hypothetical protein
LNKGKDEKTLIKPGLQRTRYYDTTYTVSQYRFPFWLAGKPGYACQQAKLGSTLQADKEAPDG